MSCNNNAFTFNPDDESQQKKLEDFINGKPTDEEDEEDDGIPTLTSAMLGVDTTHLDGEKIHIEELIDKRIIVFGSKLATSKFADDHGVHNPLAIVQLCLAHDKSRTKRLLFTEAESIVQFVQYFKNQKYKYPYKVRVVKKGYSYSFE